MISAAIAALALLAATPADEPARYSLRLSVVEAGVETIGAQTVLVEDGSAILTVQDATGLFEMNAALTPVQGDGDGELALAVSIIDGDSEPQEPRLILRRGSDARVVIGREDAVGQMIEGLEITLAPLPAGE